MKIWEYKQRLICLLVNCSIAIFIGCSSAQSVHASQVNADEGTITWHGKGAYQINTIDHRSLLIDQLSEKLAKILYLNLALADDQDALQLANVLKGLSEDEKIKALERACKRKFKQSLLRKAVSLTYPYTAEARYFVSSRYVANVAIKSSIPEVSVPISFDISVMGKKVPFLAVLSIAPDFSDAYFKNVALFPTYLIDSKGSIIMRKQYGLKKSQQTETPPWVIDANGDVTSPVVMIYMKPSVRWELKETSGVFFRKDVIIDGVFESDEQEACLVTENEPPVLKN